MTQEEATPFAGTFSKNNTIESFMWDNVTVVTVPRGKKSARTLLSNVKGIVKAGELYAIMGASGSGKSTLLTTLGGRLDPGRKCLKSNMYVNGVSREHGQIRPLVGLVEQNDALIGALTVYETVLFAAKLSLPAPENEESWDKTIDILLAAFGLSAERNCLVGTSTRRGLSGGQKRRLSVAAMLIRGPRILLLDEPTSGLDAAAAFEVVDCLKRFAREYHIVVIAALHQPSEAIFYSFDRLLVLHNGRIACNGPVDRVIAHLEETVCPIPWASNPAEFVSDLVNTDFHSDDEHRQAQIQLVEKVRMNDTNHEMTLERSRQELEYYLTTGAYTAHPRLDTIIVTLIYRSFVKSYRDVVAYEIRIAICWALAILTGTVWLRLSPTQENIQTFSGAIFFCQAFISFMAVSYIPAFLEDRAIFVRERADNIYGPAVFLIVNFIVGIPYLFVISVLFSVVAYWLTNYRPTTDAFWTWTMWIFLDLVSAESLVTLVSSITPNFVVALAGSAFVHGLLMCTAGFLVTTENLTAFWRYTFHYINYQTYIFRGMMENEFEYRNYTCATLDATHCNCIFDSALASECVVPGSIVLQKFGYGTTSSMGVSVVITLCIVCGYRVLSWLALYARRI